MSARGSLTAEPHTDQREPHLTYRLLDAFQHTFEGKAYLHRRSGLGDFVAMHLYEDLYDVGKSADFRQHVDDRDSVLNVQNKRRGIKARRGDGTFGELIPNAAAIEDKGYQVARGLVATVEVGVEMKILAKAMIKQIDRVIGDLVKQVGQFKKGSGNPICVGIVGINSAQVTTSYEGARAYPTDGKHYLHPIQEAKAAEKRLVEEAKAAFDEFLILATAPPMCSPTPSIGSTSKPLNSTTGPS